MITFPTDAVLVFFLFFSLLHPPSLLLTLRTRDWSFFPRFLLVYNFSSPFVPVSYSLRQSFPPPRICLHSFRFFLRHCALPF